MPIELGDKCRCPAGTMVSLFNSRSEVPVLARIPRLFPRANPRFDGASMTVTPGHRRAAAALPSLD
jgi:hypothetical protein